MAYERKIRNVYRLIWNGEEIDSFYDYHEAKEMRREYALAFHCGLSSIIVKKGRERIGA